MIIFSVFYYRIYSVAMERMDEELLGEIEYYSEFKSSFSKAAHLILVYQRAGGQI